MDRRYVSFAVLTFLALASAGAATRTVTTTADHAVGVCDTADCTLREAIATAQPNDVIQFAPAVTGSIILASGQFRLDKNVTIVGPGARRLSIDGNDAGGIFEVAQAVTVSVSGLTLKNGRATLRSDFSQQPQGGAIYNRGDLTLTACRITNNRALATTASGEAQGGGIFNTAGATLTMRECEISHNRCQALEAKGGGIFNSGAINMTNCTIAKNRVDAAGTSARGLGGGIYAVNSSATMTAVNCTIANNEIVNSARPSEFGGGVFRSHHVAFILRNTIVAGNRATSGPDVYCGEGQETPFTSEGHNLIGNIGTTIGWKTDPADPHRDFVGTAGNPLSPDFTDPNSDGTPANNGGPTDTYALQPASIAVDAGDDAVLSASSSVTTDQRGYPRQILAHVDIGAFEYDSPQLGQNLVVTTIDEHNDGVCGGADCTLWEAANAANAIADVSTIRFAAGLSGTITNAQQVSGIHFTAPANIEGPGASILTISGANVSRVFRVTAGHLTISGVTIANGNAAASSPTSGGGIYNDHASVTLRNCAVTGNVGAQGGGIYNQGASSGEARFTAESCTLNGNSATLSAGGAIYSHGVNGGSAAVSLTNCTVTGNTTPSGVGAGIYLFGTNGTATGTLVNCTFGTNNVAVDRASLVFANSLFQAGASGSFTSFTGSFVSQGHNLSTDNGGGFLTGPNDKPDTDPILDVLRDNGGPTRTMALLSASSPAVNAADGSVAPATDQRGFARAGASDIGAFEFGGTAPTPPPTPTPSATPTATPEPNRFANISTRLRVETGNNVLIGGLIIAGEQPKRLIVRAIGPSSDVPGALGNPQLEIYRGDELIASNDNWREAPNQQEIIDSTLAPTDERESAILTTLTPGVYTAIVSGVGGETGVGSVQAYDLDLNSPSTFANISTRGFVQTGADAMIGGLIILGDAPRRVIFRAIGPSLGIAGQLEDPVVELFNSNGDSIGFNNDWRDTQAAEIEETTIPPSNDREAAIVTSLPPAAYTAIVRGVNDTTGVAVVEAYALQ